jgi:hypothetical protein
VASTPPLGLRDPLVHLLLRRFRPTRLEHAALLGVD